MSKPEQPNRTPNYMPILTLILFIVPTLVAVFAVFIPKVKEISQIRAEKAELEIKRDLLKSKYNTLTQVDTATLESDLDKIELFIPSQLTLSQLATLVNQTAAKHSLKVANLTLLSKGQNYTEIASKTGLGADVKEFENVEIQIVSGPFAFEGDFNSVLAFIESLNQARYATKFSQISLVNRQQEAGSIWQIEFSILGYIMEDVTEVPIYTDIPPTNKSLLEEIRVKQVSE